MTVDERRERAKYLRRLRRAGRMSPADAWYTVKPRSKASEVGAAELCRREIRWLEDIEYAKQEQEQRSTRWPFGGVFGLEYDA